MGLNILNLGPEPTAVAEANAKQAFVDILDIDVIRPLATFKVNEQDLIWAYVFLIVNDTEGHHRQDKKANRGRSQAILCGVC
jgi:hypothetical protein